MFLIMGTKVSVLEFLLLWTNGIVTSEVRLVLKSTLDIIQKLLIVYFENGWTKENDLVRLSCHADKLRRSTHKILSGTA